MPGQQLFELKSGDDSPARAKPIFLAAVFAAAGGENDDAVIDLNAFAFRRGFVERFERRGEVAHETLGRGQLRFEMQGDAWMALDCID